MLLVTGWGSRALPGRRGLADPGGGLGGLDAGVERSAFCQLLEAGVELVGGCGASVCVCSSSAISSSKPVNVVVLPCWSVRRPSIGRRSRSISSCSRRRSGAIGAKSGCCTAWSRRGRPCTRPLCFALSTAAGSVVRRRAFVLGEGLDLVAPSVSRYRKGCHGGR